MTKLVYFCSVSASGRSHLRRTLPAVASDNNIDEARSCNLIDSGTDTSRLPKDQFASAEASQYKVNNRPPIKQKPIITDRPRSATPDFDCGKSSEVHKTVHTDKKNVAETSCTNIPYNNNEDAVDNYNVLPLASDGTSDVNHYDSFEEIYEKCQASEERLVSQGAYQVTAIFTLLFKHRGKSSVAGEESCLELDTSMCCQFIFYLLTAESP